MKYHMRIFNRKPNESRRIDDDSRFDEGKTSTKDDLSRSKQGDLDCEEAIMKDKERFGRVRNSLMKHLRATYGDEVSKRAQWRVNRRRTEGYFHHS